MLMLNTILDLEPRAQHGCARRQRAPFSAARDLATVHLGRERGSDPPGWLCPKCARKDREGAPTGGTPDFPSPRFLCSARRRLAEGDGRGLAHNPKVVG